MDPLTIIGLSYVGKEAVAVVGDFARKIFGASAEAIGDGLAVPYRQWAEQRADRAQAIIIDAALVLDQAGVEPQRVPGRILMPILEKGSVEEDPELRQVWSRLLASAAMPHSGSRILAAYAHILAELTPLEVKILEFVTEECQERVESEHSKPFNAQIFRLAVVSKQFAIEPHLAMAIRDNLFRLFLIQAIPLPRDNPKDTSWPYSVTTLGCEFYEACTGKNGYPDH